jgi:hypothetical protein
MEIFEVLVLAQIIAGPHPPSFPYPSAHLRYQMLMRKYVCAEWITISEADERR